MDIMPTPVTLTRESMTELVHCIQRERGATCGWLGAGGIGAFGELVHSSRILTNEALNNCRAEVTRQVIGAIREDTRKAITLVTGVGSEGDPKQWVSKGERTTRYLASSFYALFKRFNALVKSLLEETTALTSRHHGTHWDSDSQHVGDAYDSISGDAFADFARLKECTGMERAFIVGALALPESCLPQLPARAYADLIIGMQQARAYEAALRTSTPPRLLNLIRAGFDYAPALKAVQDQLLEDFNIAKLRKELSAEQWFEMSESMHSHLPTPTRISCPPSTLPTPHTHPPHARTPRVPSQPPPDLRLPAHRRVPPRQ